MCSFFKVESSCVNLSRHPEYKKANLSAATTIKGIAKKGKIFITPVDP